MPNIKNYFRRKKSAEAAGELAEVEKKLRDHKRKILIYAGLMIALLAIIGVIIYLVLSNMTFHDYKILKKEERKDDGSAVYQEFGDHLLRYGKDGISYVGMDDTEYWNQTYEMQNPMLDMNGTSAAVADQGGNKIYIFDEKGLQGVVDTTLPISKIRTSKQGTVVAILADGTSNKIGYYDKEGVTIAETKSSMAASGYPVDLDISGDGMMMMVSWLHITNGTMNTKVAFYNFDSVGQEKIDNVVSAYEYNDSVIPHTGYLDARTSYIAADDKLIIYSGTQVPKAVKEIEVNKQIKSVFHSDKYIGMVLINDSEAKNPYQLVIYNYSGSEVLKKNINTEVKSAKFEDNKIILQGGSHICIYNTKGKKVFEDDMDGVVQNVLSMKGINKYMVILDTDIQTIRLK